MLPFGGLRVGSAWARSLCPPLAGCLLLVCFRVCFAVGGCIRENGPVGVSGPFVFGFGCRRCPTLPHTAVCSTIGAGGLSFRVRDGSGRFPAAVATDKFLVFGVVLVVDTV